MPPVVVGVVAGIAAGVAGATAAVAIGIGMMAMAAYTTLTMKKPSVPSLEQERKQTLRSSNAPLVASFGKSRTAGLLCFTEEQTGDQDKDEMMYMYLAITGHPIEGVDQIWVGDKKVETFPPQLLHIDILNNPTVASPYLLANAPSWKPDMIGKGICGAAIGMKFDQEQFGSGVPNFQFEKRGTKLYDPRGNAGTYYSANPALVWLWYMTDFMKVPLAQIDLDSVRQAASICDEQVSTATGQTERRYECHGEFNYDEEPAKVIADILATCAGMPTFVGGMHGIRAGGYYGPAIAEIHEHQLIGDVQFNPESGTAHYCNTITGTYVDPLQNYSRTDFPPVSIAANVAADGKEIADDIKLRFVISPWQAQRLANIELQKRQYGRTLQLTMNVSGYAYRPGEYVKFYMPSIGIDGYEYRIADWDFHGDSGVRLTLIEEPAAVYSETLGREVERPPQTNLNSGGVPAPANLRFDVQMENDVVQGVLSWTAAYAQVNGFNVIITHVDTNKVVYTANVPGEQCRINGLAVGKYKADVITIGAISRSKPASIIFSVAIPSTPDVIDVVAANWSVELRPKFVGNAAFGTLFEFWYADHDIADNLVETTATKLGIAGYLVLTGLMSDTNYWFWVRSVNSYGHSAMKKVTTKTTADMGAILEAMKGNIALDMLVDELQTPIKALEGVVDSLPLITEIPGLKTGVNDNATALNDLVQVELPKIRDGISHLEDIVTGSSGGITTIVDSIRQSYKMIDDAASAALEAATANAEDSQIRDVQYAEIFRQQKVIADATESMSTLLEGLRVSFLENTASLVTEQLARANADEALAQQITQLVSDFGNSNAAFQIQMKALADADQALTQRVDTLKSTTDQNTAAIQSEATARTTADTALSTKIDSVQSNVNANAAATQTQMRALADADTALGSRVDTVTATTNTKGRIFRQTAAPTSGMKTNDIWIDTDDGNKMYVYGKKLTTDTTETWQVADNAQLALNAAAIQSTNSAMTTADTALGTRIDTVQAKANNNLAAITAEQSARATADNALSGRIDQTVAITGLKARVFSQTAQPAAADSKLNDLWFDTDNGNKLYIYDKRGSQTTPQWNYAPDSQIAAALAAVSSETTARTTADTALGSRIDTVTANVGGLTTSVQTVTQAQATLDGKVSAGWYTKATLGSTTAGFGLKIALAADGSAVSSFMIDADVFQVMNKSNGTSVKAFLIKNGTVYMNHAVMDTAEIGNIIAKYIKVTTLNAVTISGSTFSGGSMALGPNANGPWSMYGHKWNCAITDTGRGHFQELFANSGSFTGTVNANSGVFNNVTINASCTILGTLRVDQLVGDVVNVGTVNWTLHSVEVGSGQRPHLITWTFPAANFARYLKSDNLPVQWTSRENGGRFQLYLLRSNGQNETLYNSSAPMGAIMRGIEFPGAILVPAGVTWVAIAIQGDRKQSVSVTQKADGSAPQTSWQLYKQGSPITVGTF